MYRTWGYGYPRGYLGAGLGYPYQGWCGYPWGGFCPVYGWGYPGWGYYGSGGLL